MTQSRYLDRGADLPGHGDGLELDAESSGQRRLEEDIGRTALRVREQLDPGRVDGARISQVREQYRDVADVLLARPRSLKGGRKLAKASAISSSTRSGTTPVAMSMPQTAPE